MSSAESRWPERVEEALGTLREAAASGALANTEVAAAVLAMLDAAGIEVFELGLWQAWGPAAPAAEGVR